MLSICSVYLTLKFLLKLLLLLAWLPLRWIFLPLHVMEKPFVLTFHMRLVRHSWASHDTHFPRAQSGWDFLGGLSKIVLFGGREAHLKSHYLYCSSLPSSCRDILRTTTPSFLSATSSFSQYCQHFLFLLELSAGLASEEMELEWLK